MITTHIQHRICEEFVITLTKNLRRNLDITYGWSIALQVGYRESILQGRENTTTDCILWITIIDISIIHRQHNPYAINHIIDHIGGNSEGFKWDKKGNMITHYDKINDNERHFSWTEDNRLEAVFR